jgi:hypothetical protein
MGAEHDSEHTLRAGRTVMVGPASEAIQLQQSQAVADCPRRQLLHSEWGTFSRFPELGFGQGFN